MDFTKEQQIDVIMTISLFRCLNEQLYSLKGNHSKVLKMKFNRLLNVARAYEREVIRQLGESEALENVYDEMMDLITQVKENINEQTEASLV